MNRNIKLIIAYDGTEFHGWQRQAGFRTVQGEIENALFKMHGHHVGVSGCGRTDSGVHAKGQAANFITDIDSIPADRFSPALNSLLSRDARVLESSEVDINFHARFSAKSRLYRYQFLCGTSRDSGFSFLPYETRYNLRLRRYPSLEILNSYGRLLLGETDCSIFADSGDSAVTEGRSKNRFIYSSYFYMEKDSLIFEIRANAFLRKMVRSVAGTFLRYEEIGAPPAKMREIIASGDRSLAGPTLPPCGLFLWNVEY
ncbi:MAG: tRNA pseudouridine(38-40) synthase TruA [Treponema sp.]|nr:tRNA pseudouridine(38-40) synthase TruA [Treponema sp.]